VMLIEKEKIFYGYTPHPGLSGEEAFWNAVSIREEVSKDQRLRKGAVQLFDKDIDAALRYLRS
jgi:hypothetical protein